MDISSNCSSEADAIQEELVEMEDSDDAQSNEEKSISLAPGSPESSMDEGEKEDLLDLEPSSATDENILASARESGNFESEMQQSFNTVMSDECSEMKTNSYPNMVFEETTPSLLNVALPQILQYKRESEEVELSLDGSNSTQMDTPLPKNICQFCKHPIKPLVSLQEQMTLAPEEIYCCESYQEFLHMVLLAEIEEAKLKMKSKVLEEGPDINNQKMKKEKGISGKDLKIKVKTRETNVPQRQHEASQQLHPQLGYHMARHMNTINYQLSSRRCLDAGWTVCVPELEKSTQEDVFVIEPRKCSLYRSNELSLSLSLSFHLSIYLYTCTYRERERERGADRQTVNFKADLLLWEFLFFFCGLLSNFYSLSNGQQLFLNSCSYPSGKLAILISSILPYHFTYIVYGEVGRKQQVMAVFEHTGYGTCYHPNGNVRLYIDPAGGMEMSPAGSCRKKWLWKDLQCHAPPLQPIFIHLNRFIGMKVLSQQNIQLTFTFRRFSCRMNLGVCMKPVAVSKWVPLVDEHSLYLEDKRNQIESLLDKVRNLLNYSCSPKLNKILPPIYLTNRINKLSAKKQNIQQNIHTAKSIKIQPNIQLQV
ncbi:glutamate-rich protein 6 [Octopus bimaculoides]|uniref:glutamate-rich protein 6 n=1 Tax=Octopus bimaculoides TaxID=37653 RepID=UPI0022E06627|nr:glutamate-rich protein 6 [Octopus bimaculoides]